MQLRKLRRAINNGSSRYYFKTYPFRKKLCRHTKTQIKAAVEEIFKVKVASVNTMNVYGKIKRQGRTEGLTGNYKKAIVQLSSDSKSIEFFDSLS